MSDLQCPARVFVARHGEAGYAVPDVLSDEGGWLTDLGRRQAGALAEALGAERIAAVYCSPLARAVETAEEVAGLLGVRSTVLPGTQELAVGDLAGRPFADLPGAEVYAAWLAGDLAAPWPGGETGVAILARMSSALDEVADRHRGEAVLVVSHGGVMSLVLPLLAVNAGSVRGNPPVLTNCAVVALERDGDGWRLVRPWPTPAAAESPASEQA